ncbi:hypothetical protein CTAYLR_005513 [Chrysophaeum taylorii]|uniref:Uncharacterized protein n=1 Tax=Chrysophaeum taylorii TaxID=2483200 RepID=A0AAD7XGB2_9STRA|nr:hypothetical protein CTAYLR_005513 [Chrysophaeum taylorii]
MRLLEGHLGRCFDCEVLGSLAITASEDGTAKVWEVSGKCVRTLEGHADEVLRVAWAPPAIAEVAGAPLAATGGADGTARLWRHASELRRFACSDQVYGLAWLSEWLATASDRVRLWDVSKTEVVAEWAYDGTVFDLAVCAEAFPTLVACATSDGTLRVCDYRAPDVSATVAPPGRPTAVAWHPRGDRLAASGLGAAWVYDARTWRIEDTKEDHAEDARVYGCAWLAGSLVSWAADGTLALSEGRLIDLGFPIFHACAAPDQELLAVGGADAAGCVFVPLRNE